MDGDRLRFTAINYKESGMSEIVWATKGKRVERRVYVTFVSRNKQFAIYVTQQACGEAGIASGDRIDIGWSDGGSVIHIRKAKDGYKIASCPGGGRARLVVRVSATQIDARVTPTIGSSTPETTKASGGQITATIAAK